MPTTPLRVASAAGLTAGSIATTGTDRAALTASAAAAVPTLQAMTIALAPRAVRNDAMSSDQRRTSSIGLSPQGARPESAT